MSDASLELNLGQRVLHPELGEGVITGIEPTGFVRVFFLNVGERQVPPDDLAGAQSWTDRVITGLQPVTPQALERLWLAIEAAELPLMESAATLTSAKVDLLPHQVVLVHRIAQARPRRFLIADEVGLGKTIESALVLRELAYRGELERVLIIAPAGLVDNWRREMNEVFNLDFEVFGSEGDVTDRRSNAFVRHNRLIASIDTLKRRARVRRLLQAPQWDLVVFDEAHHLSVYKTGNKLRKTENFKLAEALRDHCRDMLLLSATPHQGDHFRFWSLIRLLDPALFTDEYDMMENRYRLNTVVARRTKADACDANGDPLFARRMVHTEAFSLSPQERMFYDALREYLQEGYNLARKQGGQGRALGFVMTIFQKIAASSFAAVKATLHRRLLMLTIQEAVECDELLDVDGRERALKQARTLIQEMHNLGNDPIGRAQADQILADARVQILKKRQEASTYVQRAESYGDNERVAEAGEESAIALVSIALPEERQHIRELLVLFPENIIETKTRKLLDALRQLWQVKPYEKVVVFATYLGSIDAIKTAIETTFPDCGVEILKGGDHGAKVAAQRRFKRAKGPQVLLCTAAGREGINLQYAHILFNYDLPWNPMDLEQRIGRIHRYGQEQTAQVYNLVAQDTIEGEIFLLLEEKLQDIAETMGKVDDRGQVTEDLRGQVLGQLSSRLNYDKLYREALADHSLKRTIQEIEVAMDNARLAREVVFELFQDLDRFNLSDYFQFDDGGAGMRRLVAFVQRAATLDGARFRPENETIYALFRPEQPLVHFSIDRDEALKNDRLELLGLEHPIVKTWLDRYTDLAPEHRGVVGRFDGNGAGPGLVTIWRVTIEAPGGQVHQQIIRLGINADGYRAPHLERLASSLLDLKPVQQAGLEQQQVRQLVNGKTTEMLHRQIEYAGMLPEGATYSTQLLACLEVR